MSTLPRLTVEQCRKLMHAGVLVEAAPFELLNGLLMIKDRRDDGPDITRVGVRHSYSVMALYDQFNSFLGNGPFLAWSQCPITISDYDEPEPDVSVFRGEIDDYREGHPRPNDA